METLTMFVIEKSVDLNVPVRTASNGPSFRNALGLSRGSSPLHADGASSWSALFIDGKKHVVASVLLIAGFVPIKAKGTLFTIRDNRYLLELHANVRKIVPRSLGAVVAQNHVIVGGASLVTVPFNFQHSPWMIVEIGCAMIERVHAGTRQGPLIIAKENVLQTRFSGSLFFLCQLGTLRR